MVLMTDLCMTSGQINVNIYAITFNALNIVVGRSKGNDRDSNNQNGKDLA